MTTAPLLLPTMPISLPWPLALPTFSRPASLPADLSQPPIPKPSSPSPKPSLDTPPSPSAEPEMKDAKQEGEEEVDVLEQPSIAEEAEAALSALLHRLDLYHPGAPPPSSRILPSHLPLPSSYELLSLTGLWNYAGFVGQKAADVAGDVLRHGVWGPKRKSWGVSMTVLSAFMRGVGKWSGLGNLALIRLLMSLPTYLPPSNEALITPIAFRVKRRHLRGLLASYDAKEDGTREITAEWVVSKQLWKKLNAEWKRAHSSSSPPKPERNPSSTNSSSTTSREPSQPPPSRPTNRNRVKGRVILYLHGGAYYVFTAATHRPITIPLSVACSARVFAINYRLAPETRFPGPLLDAVAGYMRLTVDMQIPPSSILLAGDSAGGGLALALAMYLRDNNYPLPSGLILLSPWVDLTMSSDSWESNALYDIVPVPEPTSHLNPVLNYLGPGSSGIGRWLTHPYASPLFGRMDGLPPMLIQCGEAEVLRDEGALLAHKAARAGVKVEHEVYEDAVHVFQMLPGLMQTGKAWEGVRGFVRGSVTDYARGMREKERGGAGGGGGAAQELGESGTIALGVELVGEAAAGTGVGGEGVLSPGASLDAETVAPTTGSVVVNQEGEEVAKGREESWREMERPGAEGEGSSGESDTEPRPRRGMELGEELLTPALGESGERGADLASGEAGSTRPPAAPAASTPAAVAVPRPRQHRRQPSFPSPSTRPRRSTAYSSSSSSCAAQAPPGGLSASLSRATGLSLNPTLNPATSSSSASAAAANPLPAPPPLSIPRSSGMQASYSTPVSPRSRAMSHPELKELVRSWWEEGPGVRTVRWSVVPPSAAPSPASAGSAEDKSLG